MERMNIFVKKAASLFLSILMILSSSIYVFAAEDTSVEFSVKIVHTNDIHARVQENASSGIIGMPKLKSIIDDYTDGADMDLVLDSGDLFHGQSIATLVQGESVAELVKECGYDAMTAGNHDWNYGKDRLKELAEIAGLEMLTGNVVDENGNQFFNNSYYIETAEKDGQEFKVGIFGVIDPSIYSDTAPTNVAGLTFTDPVEYANTAALELEAMDCDVVIGLTHTYDPAALASNVNGVDLWLAGHEHTDIDTSVTTPDGSTAYVIENGYYLYEAGLIDLNCTLDLNGNITDIECNADNAYYSDVSAYEDDQDVKAVLDKIIADESVILNQVVGSSPADLDGVWEHLRVDETNMGRAVTDAYLLETGADIAFENAGGIRASVSKGNVTYSDIIGISPYGNYIVTKQITGNQLKEVLETSIDIQTKSIYAYETGDNSIWPENSGSYLQVGGVTVEYNPSLEYGNRVLSVKVGGEPLKGDKLYTIATNNFVAVSSYYPQIANAEETGEYSACDEALINYFKQDENTILSSVTTARMIQTDVVPTTVPETTVDITTTPTGTSSADATSATETQAATAESVKTATPDSAASNNSGAVQTGGTVAASIVLVCLLSAAAVYTFYKRRLD